MILQADIRAIDLLVNGPLPLQVIETAEEWAARIARAAAIGRAHFERQRNGGDEHDDDLNQKGEDQ